MSLDHDLRPSLVIPAAPRSPGRVVSGSPAAGRSLLETIRDYASIARPDHWIKNVFMLLGVLLACFYHPELLGVRSIWPLFWAVVATCLVASSNYVLNEILDAPTDRSHPVKSKRPIPSGRISLPVAYAEWVALGAIGLLIASSLSRPFFYSAAFLLFMGLVYNVPPVRSKEHPYVDVLSESINNPIRLLLGWFAIAPGAFPPVSLLISYWMIGAFFMATKRFSEYRSIADPAIAAAYRKSFRHYDERKLLISMVFYATSFALFLGVFIIRYHLELILTFPLIAGFICYYMQISFKQESAAQNPEHLYRESGLIAYLVICLVAFGALMFVKIPFMYELFNVRPPAVSPLWQF
jgi:4-hydroxybenzoate polyprenyltransferase